MHDARPVAAGLLLLLSTCAGPSPDRTGAEDVFLDTATMARISTHLARALGALRDSGDVAARELEEARVLNPEDDVVTYLLAVTRAVAADTTGLAAALDTLAARRSCLAPIEGQSFPRWEGVPAVARALRAVRDRAPALRGSGVAFSLPDRTLFPEGITYDPKDGAIFLGSLRRRMILRVDRRQAEQVTTAPFVAPGGDPLYSVLGMKVDPVRRRLWAVTAGEGFAEDETAAEVGRSAVVVYDLESGRSLRRFDLSAPPERLTNDLALDAEGSAWVTDTQAGALYHVAIDADSIETVLPPGSMAQPNGIVVTPDGRGLLIADGPNGLWYLDLSRRALRRVPQRRGIMPIFLDGLAVHGRTVVAVAHPMNLGWVLRFEMTPTFDTIQGSEVMACNDPRMRQPTTGVVAGDTLFYIGVSQYPRIPPPGRPVDLEGLVDIAVLRLPLGG